MVSRGRRNSSFVSLPGELLAHQVGNVNLSEVLACLFRDLFTNHLEIAVQGTVGVVLEKRRLSTYWSINCFNNFKHAYGRCRFASR
jgi:hypothetical protein